MLVHGGGGRARSRAVLQATGRRIILCMLLCSPAALQAMPDALLEQLRRLHRVHGPALAQQAASGLGLALRTARGDPLVPVIMEREVTGRAGFQARLAAAGARLDAMSRSYLRVLVPLGRLGGFIDAFPDERLRAPYPATPMFGLGGAVSESVDLTGADGYQAGGLDGAGTKVAVIDLGFAQLEAARAAGELPATACDAAHSQDFTGSGLTTGTIHGTGVAEHLADMAPGAELYCLKVDDPVALQNAADYLRSNGIRIANHSVGWVLASYYDDSGAINGIVNDSRDSDGVFWVLAAGNVAQRHWRGSWTDADGDGMLEFAGGDELMALSGTAGNVAVFLNWDQYGFVSKTDLDLYIENNTGAVVASSTTAQGPLNDPVEAVSFVYAAAEAPYSIRVARAGGASATGLDITLFSFNHDLEYAVAASSLLDPVNAHGAFSVGAISRANWPQANPPLRAYSSRGPTSDGRLKPELVAPDGTASLTYGVSSGTSFSAPTVAGAAALLLQEDPALTAAMLAARLQGEAIDVGAAGADTLYGAGKLQLPLVDSDGDGLSNVAEIRLGTGVLVPDSDGDTLSDGDEVNVYHTSPLAADTDGDLFDDAAELLAGTDPNVAGSFPGDGDLNGDGVLDIRDLLLALRHVQGGVALTASEQAHGDVTRDGAVGTGDLVMIAQRALAPL